MFTHHEFDGEKPTWLSRLEKAFIDYYGEDRVDIVDSTNPDRDCATRNPYLVVYFPEVDIKRYEYGGEYRGAHHVIHDLFIFITLDMGNKCICSGLHGLRTTYTKKELISSYSHSHLQSTSRDSCHTLHYFCTGSGPIVRTMGTLATSNNLRNVTDETLTLFAWQLDLLVPVESQEGVPYNSLLNISDRASSRSIRYISLNNINFNDLTLNKFIKYLAGKKYFKFCRANGHLYPSRNIVTSARDFSKLFVEFLIDSNFSEEEISSLVDCYFCDSKIVDNKLHELSNRGVSLGRTSVPAGTTIVKMHDQEYKLQIIDDIVNHASFKCMRANYINYVCSYVYYKVNFTYDS